jgi:two-component system sensor histidine kinase/response regulator
MFARVKALLAPLAAIVALLLLTDLSLNGNRATVRENNVQSMDAYLQVVEKLISGWRQGHLSNVQSLSTLSWVQRWAAAQLAMAPGRALRDTDYQQLRQVYEQQGYQGYALFDAQMRLQDDSNHGMQQRFEIPPQAREVLAQAQADGAAMSRVFPAPLSLPLRSGTLPAGTPMYMVCVAMAVKPKAGVLCLHFDQTQGIDQLLSTFSDPRHGHVYALHNSGQAFGQHATLTRLPGPDLSGGYREPLPAPGQPASGRMLRWSEELQLGLVLETPMEQLYASYYQTRQLTLGLVGVAVLLIMALSAMALRNRRQLSSREAFYHQVLDQLPAQVRIRDVQGKLLVSNSLARQSGYTYRADVPLGESTLSLPECVQNVSKLFREVLRTGQQDQVCMVSGEHTHPDFHAWLLLGFPIFDSRGRLHALGSLAMDQTAQTRDQRALSALTSELEQQVSQRTAELALARDAAEAASQAKAQFLANMSHEIRSPLNAVIGLAHLAERNSRQPRNQDYLRRILQSAQYLQELVNNILDFSKLEASKLQLEQVAFAPARLLESVSDMLWEKAQHKQLELICDLDPGLPQELYGDPLRISQILLNFADNAVKFSQVGCVVVRIRLEEQHGEFWQLCFEVQDSGIGIASERLADIFRPFEQIDSSTPRQFGGTGLGLAICAQLAQLMGGSVQVKSQPGMGSLFTLQLRLQGVAASSEAPLLLSSRRALVVDEQRSSRQRLVQMLAALGVRADEAHSGARACELLSQAQTSALPYDVLLLDASLGDLPPPQLLSWAAAAGVLGSTRAVLLSPHGQANPLTEQQLDEFAAVLDKPVAAQRLRDMLQRLQRPDPSSELLGRHVLLVEDQLINQEVAGELLQALGLRVSLAANGHEALACLTADNSIELVLMDVQMPELDGLQTTQLLRLRYPDLPVIAVTGNSLSGDREQCLAVGMNDYLAKPIDPRMLAHTLRRWLRSADAAGAALPAPAPASTAVSTALATPVLQQLNRSAALERLLGNERLYQSLLTRFVSEYRGCIAQLQQVLAGGDWAAAVELSHRIKSVASTIGAECLAAELDVLEQQLRSGRPVSQNTEQIAVQLQLVLAAIADSPAPTPALV